jgi:hypothetical protein
MSASGFVVALTGVAADGDLKQIYLQYTPTGTSKATATPAQLVREPCEGELIGAQFATDGTNGGTIELWDVAGDDGGADVSTADTITDAQLQVAIAKGVARLIYSQNLVATGVTPPFPSYFRFMRGLAARWVSDGSANISGSMTGGGRLRHGSV